jgi:hypothetical protein
VQGRKSNNGINQTVKGYEPKPINSTVEWRLLYIICINGVFSDILAYGKKVPVLTSLVLLMYSQ